MLRERLFAIGSGILFALGMALIVAMIVLGAGWAYYPVYLGGGFGVALGVLFYHVARESRAFRLQYLRSAERGEPLPPGGPPR
jgi:hypothetical protein